MNLIKKSKYDVNFTFHGFSKYKELLLRNYRSGFRQIIFDYVKKTTKQWVFCAETLLFLKVKKG